MTSNKDTKRSYINQLARYKAESKGTLQGLADELGYSVPTIQTWLSKTYLPTESNLDNIKIFLAGKGIAVPTARLSDETANEIIRDLREIKEREGLTLVDLAERVGIEEKNLANWFNGLSKPGALNAYHVRNYLASGDKQINLFEENFTRQVAKSDMTLTTPDGTQYISSRDIAEWTEKEHRNLIRDIETYISYLSDEEHSPKLRNGLKEHSSILSFGSTMRVESYFVEDTYQVDDNGRSYKMYWCSRKGCEMIANKMTGKKGVRFTAHYIEVFHSMEQSLKEAPQEKAENVAIEQHDNSDLTYIKNKLAELQAMDNLSDITAGLDRVRKLIEIVSK